VQVWELSGGFQIEYRGGVSRPRRKSRPQHRSQWGCIASRMRAGISPPAVNTGSVRRCGGKSPCLTGAPERFRAFLCLEQPVVKVPPAFGRRSIPAGCVAPPSNMHNILSRRAWPAGRLAALGAAPGLSPRAARGTALRSAPRADGVRPNLSDADLLPAFRGRKLLESVDFSAASPPQFLQPTRKVPRTHGFCHL
jgi:hypothetical protein